MVICLERGADMLMPLPFTVSCFSKIQIGFTFLVPADSGSPRKRVVKWVCVCVCWCVCCSCSCSCRLAYRTVWDHVHKIQDITVKFWMGNFQVTTHSVISPVKEVSLRQTGSECVCLCVLQLIHTFLAQDSALVGPRTRLHALTVSSTIYARLRLRYSAVKETSKLLGFLFRLVA